MIVCVAERSLDGQQRGPGAEQRDGDGDREQVAEGRRGGVKFAVGDADVGPAQVPESARRQRREQVGGALEDGLRQRLEGQLHGLEPLEDQRPHHIGSG